VVALNHDSKNADTGCLDKPLPTTTWSPRHAQQPRMLGPKSDRTRGISPTNAEKEVFVSVGPVTTFVVNRISIPTGMDLSEFRSRLEDAVPPLPLVQVRELLTRRSPWGEMVDLVERVAPWGFLIYWTNDVNRIVRLAGDLDSAVAYLMGNHIIMERIFRHEPSVVMYASLHAAIWSRSDGQAFFTIDKPSDQFGSFADPRVTAVGYELDAKLAALLRHLGLRVPDALGEEIPPCLRGH
jgi:hypothetical protein